MTEPSVTTPFSPALLFSRVVKFAVTSGLGLGLDFGVFAVLNALGVAPGLANLVSAACGVTFVYFASVYRVFSYEGERLLGLFAAYVIYQVVAVAAASWAVAALAEFTWPLLAKLAILPLTFSANFLFMQIITRNRRQAVARIEGTGARG